MKLSENQKNYEPLIIPLNKPIEELSKQEAKTYFDWFLAHIDERADYVRQKAAQGLGVSSDLFDFSLESLKPLWKWFLQVAEISKTPKKVLRQMEKSMRGQPQSFIDRMLEQSKDELSIFTMYVLRDIGMYLGKTFESSYPILRWTFKTTPKNYISVNEPLLVGFIDDNPAYPKPFHPDFEPIGSVHGLALKLFENIQDENDLYNLCMKWVEWIPKET